MCLVNKDDKSTTVKNIEVYFYNMQCK